MRAYAITSSTRSGGRPHLEEIVRPEPDPGPAHVSIDVEVAGIGLIDAFWAAGVMPQTDGFVPGIEATGRVRALGPGVEGLRVGELVTTVLLGGGGLAEVALARADLVAPVPDGLDPATAAVVPVNSVTAHLALTRFAQLRAGERVLVHAGVGGLGSQCGQLARLLGASRVDAVVGSDEKASQARLLGYDRVFRRADLSAIPQRSYDVVVDPVGGEATTSGFVSLDNGGRLLRVGNASQAQDVALSSLEHWLENRTTVGFNVGHWLGAHPGDGTDSLRWVLAAVAGGELRVDLTDLRGPEGLDDLLYRLLRGHTTGKVAMRLR